jgi:hypothetical protein
MVDTKATVQVVMVDMTAMRTMEELVAGAKWGLWWKSNISRVGGVSSLGGGKIMIIAAS